MFAAAKPMITALSLISLSGCGTLWQMPDSHWANQRDSASNAKSFDQTTHTLQQPSSPLSEVRSKHETTLHISKTINQAIADLGRGDTIAASKKLNAVLLKDPDNVNAMDFLAQIDMDPEVYFGEQYFEYTVRRGDSMTRIADRFIKDHLKFYILTRYSGMDNPAALAIGQKIRIPLQYKPVTVATRTLPSKTQSQEIIKAQRYLEEQNYLDAIKLLEPIRERRTEKALEAYLELAYAGEAQRLEQEGELKRANLLYAKAAKFAGTPDRYDERIALLSDQIKARDLQRLASLYMKSGQLALALKHINESLALVPRSEAGKLLYIQIKNKRVNQLHYDAMEQFNDEKFAQAAQLWNQLLALEPTHLLSKTYLERCRVILDQPQDIALSYTEE